MLVIVLLLIAAVLFAIAAWMGKSLVAAGLLAWVLAQLLPKLL